MLGCYYMHYTYWKHNTDIFKLCGSMQGLKAEKVLASFIKYSVSGKHYEYSTFYEYSAVACLYLKCDKCIQFSYYFYWGCGFYTSECQASNISW